MFAEYFSGSLNYVNDGLKHEMSIKQNLTMTIKQSTLFGPICKMFLKCHTFKNNYTTHGKLQYNTIFAMQHIKYIISLYISVYI